VVRRSREVLHEVSAAAVRRRTGPGGSRGEARARVGPAVEQRTEGRGRRRVAALGKLPLLFDPGGRWLYSVSIDVVGRLVEVVSGQPLGEFFRQRIFEPLGMVDTGFAVPEEAVGRLATLYEPAEGDGLTPIPAPCGRDFTRLEPMCSGGGGLVGTIVDYARFAQMLLSGGEQHVRVLRDPGLAGQPDGVGSFGWSGLAHTDFWVDPANEVVGVFMTQLMAPPPGMSVPQQFRTLVYQALVG
jgi:CubicO group peptidase (beta-lactamase class C family)